MKKKCKRTIAAVAALVFAMQGAAILPPAYAARPLVSTFAESSSQMNSQPEVVYVSRYGQSKQRTESFVDNWKFYLGDASGAEKTTYSDASWRQLNLPHDYSIEQEFSQSMEAESGYLPGGVGWYRKNFTIDPSQEGNRIRVDFDGVYMDATVWVNGVKLGTHPYGYSPFSVDITDQVKFGEENLIAVKVNHQTPSSRWYSGSGIYRDVNLTITNPVHVDLGGTQITTPNLEKEQSGSVTMNINTTVVNDSDAASDVSITHTLFEKGKDVEKGTVTVNGSIAAKSSQKVDAVLNTSGAPKLWSTESPNLYTVRTEIKQGEKVLDTYETTYGFRYFKFDTKTGFSLNGQNMKLKGVCMHHDQGALGAVNNRRAVERQVEILMDMGCNSIRVTHNPASQNLIDICNEKGVLVVEEIFDGWMNAKNTNHKDFARFFNQTMGAENKLCHAEANKTWAQYSLQETLLRDRNAPSVIMWSLGNEIQEGAGGSQCYVDMAPNLIRWAKEIDTSNPLTIGSNAVKRNNNDGRVHSIIADKITEAGGTSGTNYSDGGSYDELHRKHPTWKLYGSETASSVNSRGIYNRRTDKDRTADKQLTSYDGSTVGWGALANDAWRDVIQRDFVAGEYVWTGFDYIGEPTHWNGTTGGSQGPWPAPKNSYFGIIDTAGFPKDSYYLYRSQWNTKDETLHILPAWNSEVVVGGGKTNVPVVVYASNADSVKLTLIPSDGSPQQTFTQDFDTLKSDNSKGMYTYKALKDNHNKLYAEFQVPFKEGTLKAESFKKGSDKPFKTTEIKTAGKPAKLNATVDTTNRTVHADGKDLIYVTVDVVDEQGNLVPYADNLVTIDVKGNGTLVGVDNGSSPDHDSYKGKSRKAFGGKMLAIVQTTKNAGDITITASADGLTAQTVTVNTKAVADDAAEAMLDGFYMSKSYYVKTGTIPTLPETIEARFTDGTKQNVDVAWTTITAEQVSKANSFSVKGTVRVKDVDYSITVLVHVLENIGGLLNYPATTQKGKAPVLPAQRPLVMSDGTVLDVEFPVEWTIPEASEFDTEDEVVVINGTADVLGTTYPVTANVRVQKEIITIGGSVSGAAYLSQDIKGSDTLEAIKDGKTQISSNPNGGNNPTAWSNWKASQDGNPKAEITFRYDTQQSIGEAVIHFAKDNGSMRYPDANTTEIWISDGGEKWTQVTATETIGTEKDNVTPYTYKFAPFTATSIKLKLTNTTKPTGTSAKPCTAITEVELKKAEGHFETNRDAKLESLVINGYSVPESQLNVAAEKKGTTAVNAAFAEVTASGKGNAAVTILPAYEDVIHIIVEAEDHSARSYFDIELNKEGSFPADDESRDYPKETTTGIAGSQLKPAADKEGPATFVTDGDPSTHWHTNWRNGANASDIKVRWVGLDMGKEKPIVGIRVLPRQNGNTNGATTEYRVEYSNDNKNWTPVPEATGKWDANDRGWKIVEFKEPVNAQYIRVVGVHTSAEDGKDKHMSMSELRALKPGEGDLTKCTIEVPESVKVASVSKENPVMINPVIKDGETTLRYGYDYTLQFTGNEAFGTATVTAIGIGQYKGQLTANFQIVQSDATAESVAVKTAPTKTSYTAGETFDPTGLVLTVNYSDGTKADVAYTKGDANFTFAPALDAKLTVDNKTVTVTYGEKTADISITVTEAAGPDSLEKEIELAKAVNLEQYENNLEKVVFVSALRNAQSLPAGASESARANAAAQLYQARQNLAPKA